MQQVRVGMFPKIMALDAGNGQGGKHTQHATTKRRQRQQYVETSSLLVCSRIPKKTLRTQLTPARCVLPTFPLVWDHATCSAPSHLGRCDAEHAVRLQLHLAVHQALNHVGHRRRPTRQRLEPCINELLRGSGTLACACVVRGCLFVHSGGLQDNGRAWPVHVGARVSSNRCSQMKLCLLIR